MKKNREKSRKKLQIGVIGTAGSVQRRILKKAKEIGFLLAKKGVIVITGGKDGAMEFVARGVKKGGGLNIGIIKGKKRFCANKFVDIEILTGMTADGFDEFLLVMMSDALIVINGGAGTLEEIAIAYRNKKPIVVLEKSGGWADKISQDDYLDKRKIIRIKRAQTPEEVVKKAIFLAKNNFKKISKNNQPHHLNRRWKG